MFTLGTLDRYIGRDHRLSTESRPSLDRVSTDMTTDISIRSRVPTVNMIPPLKLKSFSCLHWKTMVPFPDCCWDCCTAVMRSSIFWGSGHESSLTHSVKCMCCTVVVLLEGWGKKDEQHFTLWLETTLFQVQLNFKLSLYIVYSCFVVGKWKG